MNGGTEGGGVRRVGRFLEAAAEVWRERRSEKRARAAAQLGVAPRVARSTLLAAVDARLAVRSGVRLDDFLRHRLARYAARLPVPLEALPVTFDVEGGETLVKPRPRPRSFGPRLEPSRAPLPAGSDVLAARDLRDAEAALDDFDRRAAAARDHVDAMERGLVEALASGAVIARPAIEATAEQLGRPTVEPAMPIHGLRAFVAVLVAAEAWRFSGPVLAASGANEGGLEAGLRTAPVATGLALAFALGAAVATFTFAWFALSRGAEAASGAPGAGRRSLLLAASAGAAALVPAVAAAGTSPDRWAHLALLAAVPFAGAALWRAATALGARRAARAEIALGWDRERAREALERGRREEACQRAAAELATLEADRAVARRRFGKVHRAAVAAERRAELSARAEAERLERLSEGLACALELDRYLFIRFASERDHAPLARPARARAVESGVAERLGVAG